MAGVEVGNVDFSLPRLRRDQESAKALARVFLATPIFFTALAVAFWGISPKNSTHEVVPFKKPTKRFHR